MNAFKSIFIVLCWIAASMFLTHWWLGNPEQLPRLPSLVWEQVDKFYRSANAEDVADLEFLVCFSISAVVVGLAFLACRRLLPGFNRRDQ
ncbi:hypothetical protein RY831_01790 [Noviherbaspirillum sp. CPCC 100848]|uniref:Transmembrane protein n=1 Tax=Noviherbaspirillum album TaxID=3080276 RepID=A0ABU6J2V6_9BURK|nr:hypothetical protein [Noviherbaspirillum sp. CPCC 100848]MEC4717870.1 hypothetical protein [Noviherbaspirillum sp. CPCC 100848]